MSEYAHKFSELGKKSIEQAQMECFEDFYDNLRRFVGKKLDYDECSIENYNRFDFFCGNLIHYNNKNIQITSLIPREFSTELVYTSCENFKKESSSEEPLVKSIDEELKEKGTERLCEDVKWSSYVDKVKQTLPRYEVIFGAGEFPFLNFKIARIGNKDYFWYTLTR